MMFCLGISYGYHDSAIAVINDGAIAGIYSEERFSRVKHDKKFPINALKYVSKKYKLTNENIERVAYYEDPAAKIIRIREQCDSSSQFARVASSKESITDYINPTQRIKEQLNIGNDKIFLSNHHASHLFNSLTLTSHGKNGSWTALGLTLDGVGEKQTGGIYKIRSKDGIINCEEEKYYSFPNSLGLFYSAITSFLGFEVNDAEFKVMGLASYGETKYTKEMQDLISVGIDGKIEINQKAFNFSPSSNYPYTPYLITLLGAPAQSSKNYAEKFTTIESVKSDKLLKRYDDIAASTQKQLVDIVTQLARFAQDKNQTLFYSGGVALNCQCNNELAKLLNLHISPDPGDGGSSLGAIASYMHKTTGKIPRLETPYLGIDISEMTETADEQAEPDHIFKDENEIIDHAVNLLSDQKVIGWAQGRAEFGPRALGNRSILANPSSQDSKHFVNIAVKYREPFRPFAPAVLEEYADGLFEMDKLRLHRDRLNSLNLMLIAVPAKPEAEKLIPACIHVDGTSRVQIVNEKINPVLYKLIKRFHEKTGIPALLNTSFNLRGEPIVNSRDDCIRTFLASNMHALFAGNFLYTKV